MDIPQELFNIYNQFADDFINLNFGVRCKLIYVPKEIECPNCIQDTISKKSANIYKSGGPYPFPDGSFCPYCAGEGYLKDEASDFIKLRVYHRPKDWIKVPTQIGVPDGVVQVIGFLTDLPKFQKSTNIILLTDIEPYNSYNYTRLGEAFPHGFKKNRYFISFLERT